MQWSLGGLELVSIKDFPLLQKLSHNVWDTVDGSEEAEGGTCDQVSEGKIEQSAAAWCLIYILKVEVT